MKFFPLIVVAVVGTGKSVAGFSSSDTLLVKFTSYFTANFCFENVVDSYFIAPLFHC
jgi:hypothetical protein